MKIPHFEEYDNRVLLGAVTWGTGCWVLKDYKGKTVEIWNDGSIEWYDFAKLCPEDNGAIIGYIYENLQ